MMGATGRQRRMEVGARVKINRTFGGSVRGSAFPQWVVHEMVVTVVTKKMILWYDSCFIVSGNDRASAEVSGDVAGGPRERENARRGVETNERENDVPFACGFYR